MPRAHRAHAEWTPSRLIAWAEQSGPATGRLVAGILADRPHPEQGYRACLGLMRLGRLYGADRLEAACHRAERLRSYRYRTVEHILINQQDRLPLEDPAPARPALTHENLRGATYYEETYADAPDDREAPRVAPDRDGRRPLTSSAARASMPSSVLTTASACSSTPNGPRASTGN